VYQVGTPLKQRILATPETVNSGTAFVINHRCIRVGTPLKQRILAIPETLILPTGKCLTVARVHNIDTLPWRSRAGILLFTSHWVDVAGYTGKAARRCGGGVSTSSFIGSPDMNTGHTVNSETAGECVAWLLSLAMWVRRRQDKTMMFNGCRRVEALSTVMIDGTPRRRYIVVVSSVMTIATTAPLR